MKYVEVFRHSARGEGKGLSEQGREPARQARALLAPAYELCVSSPKVASCNYRFFGSRPRPASHHETEVSLFPS